VHDDSSLQLAASRCYAASKFSAQSWPRCVPASARARLDVYFVHTYSISASCSPAYACRITIRYIGQRGVHKGPTAGPAGASSPLWRRFGMRKAYVGVTLADISSFDSIILYFTLQYAQYCTCSSCTTVALMKHYSETDDPDRSLASKATKAPKAHKAVPAAEKPTPA
jgi:hypothetical protein